MRNPWSRGPLEQTHCLSCTLDSALDLGTRLMTALTTRRGNETLMLIDRPQRTQKMVARSKESAWSTSRLSFLIALQRKPRDEHWPAQPRRPTRGNSAFSQSSSTSSKRSRSHPWLRRGRAALEEVVVEEDASRASKSNLSPAYSHAIEDR